MRYEEEKRGRVREKEGRGRRVGKRKRGEGG